MKTMVITLSYANVMSAARRGTITEPTWVADTATCYQLDPNKPGAVVKLVIAVYDIPVDAVR